MRRRPFRKFPHQQPIITSDPYRALQNIQGLENTIKIYEIQTNPEETKDLADMQSCRLQSQRQTERMSRKFRYAHYSGKVSVNNGTRARLEDLG